MKIPSKSILGLIGRVKSAAPVPDQAPDIEETADIDEPHVGVGLNGILAATGKLLAVNRGVATPDERDSLEFKRLMPVNKLMSERVSMDASKMRRKLAMLAARRGNLSSLSPFAFDDDLQGLLIGNALSSPSEEINPISLLEQARRVTLMGPGGINNDSAVTEDMQMIHGSQFGFVSPIETPESSRAGIDARLAWGTKIGSDGKIYQKFFDWRNKVYRWLSPEDVAGKTIKLPD